ncbi:MAG TPA: TlpA disulfide reductase family protein [Ferruginibacter sp.]|nr:TlpA disulfide reductase family protein [Ferruginibacter sp.]
MYAFLFALSLLSFFNADEKPNTITAEEVLKKTSENLNKYTTISYTHERDYFTGDKHYFLKGKNYFDFDSPDSVVQLKYHVVTGNYEYFFNGAESFGIDKKEKSLTINYKPKHYDMEGGSFFYNSLISLRRTLPLIIEDKSINKKLSDTVIYNNAYHLVSFSLHKKGFASFGGFSPCTEDRTFSFRLVVDKNSFLPYMLFQSNNADEHTSKITYSAIEPGIRPEGKNWYFSTYLPEYKIAADKNDIVPLPVGFEAPGFELPLFATGKMINAKEYKNKVVLVEFWIRNCGPCIESVPQLNKLSAKYRQKDVEVLAINPHDERPTVAYFINKYKPTYPIAYNGENISRTFGVSAFPTVFILNKKGNIIYSGGFDHDAIVRTIEKAIK